MTNVVVIDPDVVKYFPDHDSVNNALRSLTEIIVTQSKFKKIIQIIKEFGYSLKCMIQPEVICKVFI